MKHLLLLVCVFLAINVSAQDNKKDPEIFSKVDVMPKADYDLKQYLDLNIHYPEAARTHDVEGKVLIKFVVNENGRISDCIVVKGIGAGCDEEALRVVKGMPPWDPGEKDGRKVKVYFTLPIGFKIVDY
jgi:protein TonB